MAAIAGDLVQTPDLLPHPLPLLNEPGPGERERHGQRLTEAGNGGVETITKSDANCEFIALAEINFSHHGDVAILSAVKFPIHFEIVVQILPSVAGADTTAGRAEKAVITPQSQMRVFLPRDQHLASDNFHFLRRVAPAPNVQMRRQ